MTPDPPVLVYGAGGHGRVVADALERAGRVVVAFLDDDASVCARPCAGRPVFHGLDADGLDPHAEVIVAIGDPTARARLTSRTLEVGRSLATAVHPAATIGSDVTIGPGAMILARAAVNTGTRIGRGAIINTGAIVDHDGSIGEFSHVAPGACLAGNVTVGARALVGIGASVVPGIAIGEDAVVGAGAAVVDDVAAGVTVVGVPARAMERVRPGPIRAGSGEGAT